MKEIVWLIERNCVAHWKKFVAHWEKFVAHWKKLCGSLKEKCGSLREKLWLIVRKFVAHWKKIVAHWEIFVAHWEEVVAHREKWWIDEKWGLRRRICGSLRRSGGSLREVVDWGEVVAHWEKCTFILNVPVFFFIMADIFFNWIVLHCLIKK